MAAPSLFERMKAAQSIHEKLGTCHPKLARGQVWCRKCGYTDSVSSAHTMKHGWPKHCGETMTIDAPDERDPA